jgi:CO/xanthine dehydrogenase FAD-binding subunit
VKPAPFAYHAPVTLDEAVALAAELGDDALMLAGGQSLVPMLNLRLAYTDHLVDLNRISELAYIRRENGTLAIGAMTRQEEAATSREVRNHAPLVFEALPHVAYPAIRSRGTIGGSIANADPKAELPCVLVAAGGSVVLTSASGRRQLAAEEFFLGPYMTAREPGEILTEVRLPEPRPSAVSAFEEVSRSAGEFALALVGAAVEVEGRRCTKATVAVAGSTGAPTRARAVETAVVGSTLEPPTLAEAAEMLNEDIEPTGDIHGSAPYRRRVTVAATRRALERVAARLSGGAR